MNKQKSELGYEERNEKLLKLVDFIYEAAHNGAFNNADEEVIDSISDFFRTLLDIKVTKEQGAAIFNKNINTIKINVFRKLPKENSFKRYTLIKLKELKKCFI